MKWKSPKVLIPSAVIAIGVIIFAILLIKTPSSSELAAKIPVLSVTTVAAKPQTLAPQIILYGKVESPRYAKLDAAITAFVQAIPTLSGTIVKKGTLLIKLDDRDAHIMYQQKNAELQELHSKITVELKRNQSDLLALKHEEQLYSLSKRELERLKKLEVRKYISLSDIDKAVRDVNRQALLVTQRKLATSNHKSRLLQLKAQLSKAQAVLHAAELDLARTKILAPFDGQVTRVYVSIGDRVQPGENMIEMYDISSLEVATQIPERWIQKANTALREKKVILANSIYQNSKLTLKLVRLGSMIGTGKGAVEGIFAFTGNAKVPIGTSLTLTVNLPKLANVYAVPSTAVYNNNRIYKVIANRLQAVNVTLVGNRYNTKGVKVSLIKSSSLKPGEQIVTTHLPNAITGLKVKYVNENQPH